MVWVFCDLDGTLVDSLAALRSAYHVFLNTQGATSSDEEFARLNGPSLPEIVDRLRVTHGLAASGKELLATYHAILATSYQDQVGPCPGAEDFLKRLLADGHRLALVTAASRSMAEAVVHAQRWQQSFQFLVCGDDVARAKPAPDLYYEALRLAQTEASQAIAIEDSRNGVRAAISAGLTVIGVHGAPDDGAGTVLRVADLATAAERIREWACH